MKEILLLGTKVIILEFLQDFQFYRLEVYDVMISIQVNHMQE